MRDDKEEPFPNNDDSWFGFFDNYNVDDNDIFDADFIFGDSKVNTVFQIPSFGHTGITSQPSNDNLSSLGINHRRTTSSPMRIMTPPPATVNPPIAQLPVAQTTIDFNVPNNRVSMLLRKPDPREVAKEEATYLASLHDPSIIIYPLSFGFIPKSVWDDRPRLFGEIVSEFFQRKNHSNCRFIFKLYNALKLGEVSDTISNLVGVKWLNDYVFKVNKHAFARLLGIKSIDGSFFHQQGNFPSHGFVEISAEEVPHVCPDIDITGIDFDSVRLLTHVEKVFVRKCLESHIESCRWASTKH